MRANDKDRAVAALAEQQHGIFTSEQAEELGLKANHREFRLRSGRWHSVHSGVHRIAGVPPSWRGEVLAACWATTGLAAASHRSAAALWDLPGGSEDLIEITCRRWHRGFVPGIVVHETLKLEPDDVEELDQIPVTTVAQTLLGLAAVAGPAVAEMALDRALHRRLVTPRQLDEFVDRKGARGRNGIGVLRGLLREHDPLNGVAESAMETKLKQLLRRRGLPTPVFQHVIRHNGRFIARVDAAYPELRIAIEFDSYEHHTGKLALVRDNDRRNELRRIQWQTITFTAADLQRGGGHALEALIVALRSAAS